VTFVLLAGCASVPKASPERDRSAKQFAAPQNGKAALYVFRNESFGAAIKMSLLLDGKIVGDTAAKTFHWVEIDPGKHTLIGKAENESTLDFDAAPGQKVFVWQEVKLGILSARNKLQLVDDDKGRSGVGECELAEPIVAPDKPAPEPQRDDG
jgi:hypothetical protein